MYYDQDNRVCAIDMTVPGERVVAEASSVNVKSAKTFKDILEDTDMEINELKLLLASVADAMYGKTNHADSSNKSDDCMRDTLIRQNEELKIILNIARGIKEGMWKG